MSDAPEKLFLPEEPAALRAETRTLLENFPEEGALVVRDAQSITDFLWEEWGEDLEKAGMDYDGFLDVSRGYADELRLWVVGERPWNHCVAGLAGRVRRRLPGRSAEKDLAFLEVCR